MPQVTVYKRRVTTLLVSLGYDASNDTFVSEIRTEEDSESDLIATWDIDFVTDGTDGELVLTVDDTAGEITHRKGWMDVKRTTGGKVENVWNDPIEVIIKEPVTV